MQGLPANPALADLAREMVDHLFETDPVLATAEGDHRRDDRLAVFDRAGRARAAEGYTSLLERLAALTDEDLDPDDRLDLRILMNGARASLFELEDERPWQHDPNFYIRHAGEAISTLLKREFAPATERLQNAVRRIEQYPAFFDQALHNLANVPLPHVRVGLLQVDGLSQYIEETFLSQTEAQAPALLDAARTAVDAATTALVAFEKHLKGLSHKEGGDWRLGEELYAEKLETALVAGITPAELSRWGHEVLGANKSRIEDVSRRMGASSVADAFARLERDRSGRDEILEKCRGYSAELESFLRAHPLVTLPDKIALRIEPTPEFNRGVPGASCDRPGVLEPHLPTYFYVTPIPDSWTADEVDDYLREYNDWQLRILVIHEALPGHYLQLWHSARGGRLVPNIWGNDGFAEGWAVYAEQVMLEEGVNPDPRHELAQLKFQQRTVLNAMIDAGLHCGTMDEAEARRLLATEGHQTPKVVEEKIKRAQVTSVQLATYFVGWQQIARLRDEQKASRGGEFSLLEFNDALLSHGTPPVPYLREAFFSEVPAR